MKNLTLVIIVLSLLICFVETKHDEIYWNDGHCECGGTWDLVDIERGKTATTTNYYYECADCGEFIQLHHHY